MTKILYIQQSIDAANGNVSLAKDLFTMLLDDLNLRLKQIESSFQESDMESLAEHVYKLYGATAYCIVPQLRDCTAALEDHLRQKKYSQLEEFVDSVVNEINKIIYAGPAFLEEDWNNFKRDE